MTGYISPQHQLQEESVLQRQTQTAAFWRDQFEVTKPEKRDLNKEVALLNELVLAESRGFFDRMLGTTAVAPQNEG